MTMYQDALRFHDKNEKRKGKLLEERRLPWQREAVNAMLQAQGHFELDKNHFTDLISSVKSGGTIDDIRRLQPYLRLPFPVCWLAVSEEVAAATLPPGIAPENNIRKTGLVVEQKINPWSMKIYTFQQKAPSETFMDPHAVKAPYAIAVQTELDQVGLKTGTFHVKHGQWMPASSAQLDIDHFFAVAKLTLLMNARSGPFAFASEQSRRFFADPPAPETNARKIESYNRQRRFPTHRILFDLSRIFRGNTKHLNSDQIRELIREVLVRGHLKERKTGLFFWGPYNRGLYAPAGPNQTAAEGPPDYNVYDIVRSRPERPLILPGNSGETVSPGSNIQRAEHC